MNPRTIILFAILIILLGVGGYFLFTKFMAEEAPSSLGITKKIETEFKSEIFIDQKFLDLKQHIELPIKVDLKGKINPFMKF